MSLDAALATLARVGPTLTPEMIGRFTQAYSSANRLGRIGKRLQADMVLAATALADWYTRYPLTKDGYTLEQDAERLVLLLRGMEIVGEIEMEEARPERVTEAQEYQDALSSGDPPTIQAGRELDETRYRAWERGYEERMGQ